MSISGLRRTILALALIPAIASAAPKGNPDLPTLIDVISHDVKPEQAMEYMRHVYSTDRWFTFQSFRRRPNTWGVP